MPKRGPATSKGKNPRVLLQGGALPSIFKSIRCCYGCQKGNPRQLKETGSLFEIGFDLLSLAPGQNGAILVLILDMIGSWRPVNFRVRVEMSASR